jgi:hypothetical protein
MRRYGPRTLVLEIVMIAVTVAFFFPVYSTTTHTVPSLPGCTARSPA